MDTDPPAGTPPADTPTEPIRPAASTASAGTSTGTAPGRPPIATTTTARPRSKPLPELITELRELVIAYVKQETLEPLRSLGRWIGFGLAGSLLLGFGVVFLAMSALRALQEETGDTFTGNWSWVPYLIVIVALALGGALVWVLRAARQAERGTP